MAQMRSTDEAFEDRNAGVAEPEPQEAGPGVMGRLLTTFGQMKERVTGYGSTPSTPSGKETQQQPHGSIPTTPIPSGAETERHESKDLDSSPRNVESGTEQHERNAEDLKDSPRSVDNRTEHEKEVAGDVQGVPQEQFPSDHVHHEAVGVDTAAAEERHGDVQGLPQDQATPDQVHNNAVSINTAGAEGPDGDIHGFPQEHSPSDRVHNDAVGVDSAAAEGRHGDVRGLPQEQATPDQVHNNAISINTAGAEGLDGNRHGVPQEHAPSDRVHSDAVGVDTAGAEGRVGDGVGGNPRAVAASGPDPRGSASSFQEGGTPASPKLPRKDFAERIIDKLPGSHTNPYSVGNETPHQAANPYNEGNQSGAPTSPSVQRSSGPSSPALLFGKLKNMFTGQKPSQGTATDNATTATAGTTGEQQPLMHGYTQSPNPENGDLVERAKEMFGGNKGPDAGSAEAWPSPAKPDIGSIPSATHTDAEGRPIEGPTQPTSEDTKKEGLMTKVMDKLHLHGKSPSPRGTTADMGTGTSPATTGTHTTHTDTRPSQETGIPTPTAGGPDTTIGTASGPTEN